MLFGGFVLFTKPLDGPRALLLGMMLYLAPGMLPEVDYLLGRAAPSDTTVLLCILLILGTTIAALVIPEAPEGTQRLLGLPNNDDRFSRFLLWCSVLLYIFISIRYGPGFFLAPREEIFFGLIEQMMYRTLASIGFIIGIVQRNKALVWVATIMLIIYTIMGDRTALSMALAAWFIHRSYSDRSSFGKTLLKYWAAAIGAVLFALYGKLGYVYMKAALTGDFESAVMVQNAAATGKTTPEPIVIFTVLDQSIKHELTLDPSDLDGVLVSLIPLSGALFGKTSNMFNPPMQNKLFPAIKPLSMAYNPWAEGWAHGRWIGVGVVWAVLMAGALYLHRTASRRGGWPHAVACLSVAYGCLYGQRNTILTIIAFLTQFILGVLIFYAAFLIWNKLRQGFKDVYSDPVLPEATKS